MYRWSCLEDILGSKRRSKPSKMSDRSASLRRRSTTASGRESFPRSAGSPGSAETPTTLGPRPIALARAAGQTPSLSQAVDEVTGSKTNSDQQKPTVAGRRTPSTTNSRRSAHAVNNQQSPIGARRQLNGPRSASSAPPVDAGNHSRRSLRHVLRAENPSARLARETAVPQAAPGTRLRRIAGSSFTHTATVPLARHVESSPAGRATSMAGPISRGGATRLTPTDAKTTSTGVVVERDEERGSA